MHESTNVQLKFYWIRYVPKSEEVVYYSLVLNSNQCEPGENGKNKTSQLRDISYTVLHRSNLAASYRPESRRKTLE